MLEVCNLTKTFGKQYAVDAISFQAKQGEILGFLGPNGAGKSTTMKIATCYLSPTAGTVRVCGFDVRKHTRDVRKTIGYLPEHNPLYLDMYVQEYLQFIGSLHKLTGKRLRSQAAKMIELCGLTLEQHKKIRALSKGYRQRVGLAQALIHNPSVLILDEPTTGLDPNQIIEIRGVIKRISQEKTIIFSTHIMQEVQALCDRVVVIHSGKIVANEKTDILRLGRQHVVFVIFEEAIDLNKLQSVEGIQEVEYLGKYQYKIVSEPNSDCRAAIFRFAVAENYTLLEMRQEETSLEHIFHELTQTKAN